MKIKYLFIKITSIILMVCLTLSLSMMKANADETEYQYIPKSTGGYITYRGTSTKVEVPTVYEQKRRRTTVFEDRIKVNRQRKYILVERLFADE